MKLNQEDFLISEYLLKKYKKIITELVKSASESYDTLKEDIDFTNFLSAILLTAFTVGYKKGKDEKDENRSKKNL